MLQPSTQARSSRLGLLALIAACAGSASPTVARAQTVPTFQFEANKAAGIRNVLLVRVKYSDADFASNHDNAYYGSFFGNAAVNLSDYFKQLSGGKFGYQVVGAVGPITFPDDPATPAANESTAGCWQTDDRLKPNPACRMSSRTDANETATLVGLVSKRFNIAAFDTNKDGRVDPSELTLVFVTATGDLGKTRDMGCAPAGAVRVCGAGAFFAENTNFATMAHELWHSVSGADLYTPFTAPRATTSAAPRSWGPLEASPRAGRWPSIRGTGSAPAGWHRSPCPPPARAPASPSTRPFAAARPPIPHGRRLPSTIRASVGANTFWSNIARRKATTPASTSPAC